MRYCEVVKLVPNRKNKYSVILKLI